MLLQYSRLVINLLDKCYHLLKGLSEPWNDGMNMADVFKILKILTCSRKERQSAGPTFYMEGDRSKLSALTFKTPIHFHSHWPLYLFPTWC